METMQAANYAYATKGMDSSGNERTDYATGGSYARNIRWWTWFGRWI